MGSPTEAEIRTQIGNAVWALENFRKFAHVSTPNLGSLEDAFYQSLEGDYAAEAAAGFSSFRSQLAAAMASGRAIIAPLLADYGKVIGCPEDSVDGIIRRLKEHYVAGPYTVESRAFSFGTPSAGGSNVGDGALHALNVDENGDDIENQHAEVKTAKCVGDEHTGAQEHAEVFQVRGANKLRDSLHIAGSGINTTLGGMNGSATSRYIRNPSFSQHTGDPGSVTAIYGWTPGSSIGNFDIEDTESVCYRGYPGDTPKCLKIEANDYVEQNLNVQGTQFNPEIPLYFQIAFNRQTGSGDGTLTIKLGSQTEAVVLAAQTGWNVLKFTLGVKNWLRNWNEEDPVVRITLSGNTTGYVLVDDVILQPFSLIGGGWYALVGGATPFLLDDTFSWTDSIASDSIIQQWFWRLFNAYLPSTTGTPTWTEPS